MSTESARSFGRRLRSFANAFLVAFALDALLSIALSLGVADGTPWFGDLRAVLLAAVTVASLPLFVLLGIRPGLRWRIFLPPCLFLSWISLGAMPLPIWFSASDAGLLSGVLELAFAGIAFALCRQGNGGQGWLLDQASLEGPSFSGRTALSFTLLNFVVILPATLVYLAYSAAAGVGYLTSGFVEIRGDGIYLAHREYELEGRRIHLVAMMHIGEAVFYEELFASLPEKGAIWLAEGVTDDSGLLSDQVSYGNLAGSLGLVPQPHLAPRPELVRQPGLAAAGRNVSYADLDVSAFSPETLKLLAGAARVLGADTLREGLAAYGELSKMSSADATRTIAALKHDLIDLRNDHLQLEIEKSLPDYDEIVVPWGALHLPDIEHRIRELGFAQDRETGRRVISW